MSEKIQEKFCPGCGGKLAIIAIKEEQRNFIIKNGKLSCTEKYDSDIYLSLICENMPVGDERSGAYERAYPHMINKFDSKWWKYLESIRKTIESRFKRRK